MSEPLIRVLLCEVCKQETNCKPCRDFNDKNKIQWHCTGCQSHIMIGDNYYEPIQAGKELE